MSKGHGHGRVLCVDDSPAELELLAEAGREFAPDLFLLGVATPDAAEACLADFAPDLALIDHHLGRHSGRELAERFRGRVDAVILTTTDVGPDAVRGAVDVWIKPLRYDGFAILFERARRRIAGRRDG